MPPSYEEHADKIINHLLIDVNSPLYKKYKDEYIIIHHLVCACIYSHIKLNLNYLENFTKNVSYSNIIESLLKDKKYNFIFVLNNLHCKIFEPQDNPIELNGVWGQFPKKVKRYLKNPKDVFVNYIKDDDTPFEKMLDVNKNGFNIPEKEEEAMAGLVETIDGLLKGD